MWLKRLERRIGRTEWSHQLRRSLYNTTKALRRWNIDHFGLAHTKIKILEKELEGFNPDNSQNTNRKDIILEELRTHRARLESIIRQKSREL